MVSLAKLAPIATLILSPDYCGAFQSPASIINGASRTRSCLHEQPDELATAPPATSSTNNSDWIEEEFEQLNPSKPGEVKIDSFSSSKGLLDDGRVVGPDRVLVYDTTLRGEPAFYFKVSAFN